MKLLAKHFRTEEKALYSVGIRGWEEIIKLQDSDIYKLMLDYNCSLVNLKKIRAIASLICELNITQEEAALLIHAGIPSAISLSKYTPQELIKRIGRLDRQLKTRREPLLGLNKANQLIDLARSRQR